ncbi:sulfatase-like hydrolase/transferase [Haloferula chungangensis]|uniref:Sulfatase-like hydrolase/transferase n=1 Tax=Haloferula chungangensis TaxID=1048331 RepID=A0ABW2L113_9BACT
MSSIHSLARIIGASTLLIQGQLAPAQSSPENNGRPNLLIICTDDMGFNDLACFSFPGLFGEDRKPPAPFPESSAFAAPDQAVATIDGKSVSLTPHIDRLAAEGVRFSNYHAPAAICTPSRGGLLTGMIPARLGFTGAISPKHDYGLNTREVTLAEALKDHGYATAAIGKWHLGNHIQQLPTRHGFDRFWGITRSNNQNPKLYDQETLVETVKDTNQADLLERMTGEVLEFLDQCQEEPFFIYFAPHAPHAPMIPHPDFVGSSTKLLGKRSFLKGKGNREIHEIGESPFHDVIHELDFRVGRIMAKLNQLGLSENTIVVFTSDNGPWTGWPPAKKGIGGEIGSSFPFQGGKASLTEGGTRVPAIIRFPREIPAGVVSNELVSGLDWFPTFATRCGGSLPENRGTDGYDLWPFLTKLPEASSPRPYFFHVRALPGKVQTVSDGSHKLHVGGRMGRVVDLNSDFVEETDVSRSQPPLSKELSKQAGKTNASLRSDHRGYENLSDQELVIAGELHPFLELGTESEASFTVRLKKAPKGDLEVELKQRSGSVALECEPSKLIFNPSNWKGGLTIRVKAPSSSPTERTSHATLELRPRESMPIREVFVRCSDVKAAARR